MEEEWAKIKARLAQDSVVGEEGENCTACHQRGGSFARFRSRLRNNNDSQKLAAQITSSTSNSSFDEEGYWEKVEPPDIIELGQAGWTVLHSTAARYPTKPSPEQQEEMKGFISSFTHFYPCKNCADHFSATLREMPPEVESREALTTWLCQAHNRVNEHLGKPLFPCERVFERWGGKKE